MPKCVINGVRFLSRKTQNLDRYVQQKDIPDGCLFSPLKKGAQIAFSHPLDDEEGHLKFLQDELPREFEDLTPSILQYSSRFAEMITYNIPAFHSCWTFGPELFYKTLAPKEEQTENEHRKCKLLRACVELKFAFTTVLDDIADGSDVRKGKPAWKQVCGESMSVAMYDGILLDLLPYHIVRKHFRDTPGYLRLLETFQKVPNIQIERPQKVELLIGIVALNAEFATESCGFYCNSLSSIEMVIGETLDLMAQHRTDVMSSDDFKTLYNLKAGCFLAMQPTLGILLAGIEDDDLIAKVEHIFYETGRMIQSWDDFCDYFCTSDQTGKPSCDFQNAGTTWASVTALSQFTDEQKRVFKACYGSTDPDKVETIRSLYDSINLPYLYFKFLKSQARQCASLIADLDHEGCRESCTSWLRWLVGDIDT